MSKGRSNQAKSTDGNVVDIFTKEVVNPKIAREGRRNSQLFKGMFDRLIKKHGHEIQDCVVLYTYVDKDGVTRFNVLEDPKVPIDAPTLSVFENYLSHYTNRFIWN
jgi:hypothetical protein